MGSTNFGNQISTVKYYSPANSISWNRRNVDITPVGIYKGALLSKVSDVSVAVSAGTYEIKDATYQMRIMTQISASITIDPATPYVVARWSYAASTTNFMDLLAVSSAGRQANDLIIGKGIFAGSVLTGFDYNERTAPMSFDRFLKVEQTDTASMKVKVNSGWIQTVEKKWAIPMQESPVILAPVTDPRIDLIYVDDTTGAIGVVTGVEAATPSIPLYDGKIVLAEIYLTTSTTSITNDLITDVRGIIGNSAKSNGAPSFSRSFTNASLVANELVITHNLNTTQLHVTVYNNFGKYTIPDETTLTSVNSVTLRFATFGALVGTWSYVITGVSDEFIAPAYTVATDLNTPSNTTIPTTEAVANALAGGLFVARNPDAVDFNTGSFTKDAGFHDLDLSAIIPVGTTAVQIQGRASASATGQVFAFYAEGKTLALVGCETYIANTGHSSYYSGVVPVGVNRVIRYYGSPGLDGIATLTAPGYWK